MRFTHKNKFGMALCTGVSALVLASCMPDDEANTKRANASHDEAQIAQYAQSFQQYSSRSMNAVVNSDPWTAQTLSEGVLTLSNSALGSLDLGSAEAYVESAYCVIANTPRHLTWFEGEENNELFLQGLGKDAAGMTAAKLRGMFAKENFGIQRADGSIEMADGTSLTPTAGCNTLNIPKGSVVAVVPLPEPVSVAQTQEKYIMRAMNCPAGTEGNVMQRVTGTYMPSGAILVDGGSSFTSEAGVMADNSLSWETVANNCLSPEESIARNTNNSSADALDMANLITIPGDIKVALENNLRDIECKDVTNGDGPVDEDGNPTEEKLYDTCADAANIDPMTGIKIDDDTLLRTEEDTVMAACGGQVSGNTVVNVAPGSANYKGIPASLSGKQARLSYTNWNGDAAYKKTTRVYDITENNPEADGTLETEVVTYTGMDLQCDRNETIEVACNTMYPEVAGIQDTTGSTTLDLGWFATEMVEVNVPSLSSFGDMDDNFGLDVGESTLVDDRFRLTLLSEGDEENDVAPEYTIVDTTNDESVEAGGQVFDEVFSGNTLASADVATGISPVESDSLDFARHRTISGWQDATTLTPNQPDDTRWSQGDMSCIWSQRRTVTVPCQNGWTGAAGSDTSERHFTATSPTNGQWDDWAIVSSTPPNCDRPGDGDGDGDGGGGGGGGGGGNCLIAGTKILMADGTYQSVESITVGDLTAGGRVLQTFTRSYDDALALMGDGLLSTGGGLFEFDGIIATGRHPFHINGQWTELSHANGVRKVQRDDIKTVYNFLTENHIVPVQGATGTVYQTADDLNNWNESAEKGRLKLFAFKAVAA